MPVYQVTLTSTALNTSNDSLTITAASGKPLRVMAASVTGMGTSSAANEVALARSSGGTTSGGAITPRPTSSDSGAAGFTVATTWSSQPTLGVVLHRFGVNANGGFSPYNPVPGAEITVPSAGQLSIRSISGTSNVVINLTIEEIVG